MRYASICSGVEAATLAWSPLGWEPVFFTEIDSFPSAVLSQRWPHIPNLGDFTKITKGDFDGTIDLLVGGTPCQGFSTAGERKGLDDDRSCLAIKFLELAKCIRPCWVVWENVPGVLSCWSGQPEDETIEEWIERNDFDQFIKAFQKCGYGVFYRILDSQFVRVDGFGRAVPQRRRRVFVVGYIGDWRPAAAVLFEQGSLQGDTPPCREKGQGTSRGFEIGPSGGRQSEVSSTLDSKCKDGAIRNHEAPIICCESEQGYWKKDKVSGLVKTNGAEPTTVVCLNNHPQEFRTEDEIIYPLRATDYKQPPIICYENHPGDSRIKKMKDDVSPQINAHAGTGGGNVPLLQVAGFLPGQGMKAGSVGYESDIAPTLRSTCKNYGIVKNYGAYKSVVRRLTPLECERLMGFPDNHTQIEWNGKPKEQCPDSLRYKACGNSMCVNVMRWIGRRIQIVEELMKQ